jgi:hypothetical protein
MSDPFFMDAPKSCIRVGSRSEPALLKVFCHPSSLFSHPLHPAFSEIASYPYLHIFLARREFGCSVRLLDHSAQRTFLDHQTHDFVQCICGSHGGVLSIRVVRRCYLHDVGCDEVDAFESTEDCTKFTCGPTPSLRGTGGWRN